jgi:hypothetical protein
MSYRPKPPAAQHALGYNTPTEFEEQDKIRKVA